MFERLRRAWQRRRLADPAWAWLYEPYNGNEVVSIDCETTSLDVATAEILSVGAIRVKGDTLLTSQRLDLLVRPERTPNEQTVLVHHLRAIDLAQGVPWDAAIRRVLEFVGNRPLVGYYLEFDMAMLDKYVRRLIGARLANRRIEVSGLYYDWRAKQLPPGTPIDLRFEAIREQLDLPRRAQHDAFNDALLTAMIYLRLTGGWRPPTLRKPRPMVAGVRTK